MLEIQQEVIDEVVKALEMSIGIAMRFEPTLVEGLSATAVLWRSAGSLPGFAP